MDVQDLIVQLAHISQRIQAPQDFLHQGMPLLVQALEPLAQHVQCYRAVPQGVIRIASTRPEAVSQELLFYEAYPLYQQILTANATHIDAAQSRAYVPLSITDPQELLLEITLTPQAQPIEAVHERITTVTQIFQIVMRDSIKTWALDKLTSLSARLNQASDFEEVAQVLGEHLATRGQFTSVNLLDYDAEGHVKGFHVLVTASTTHKLLPNLYIPLEEPDFVNLAPLQNNQNVLLYNVPEMPIGGAVRTLLDQARIRAMHLVPLQVAGRTIGFVSTNDTRLLVSNLDIEQRVIRGLSGQIGAIVENRRLLTEAEVSLHETRTLYESSRRLMGAQTLIDMMHILYDTFARPDGRVSLSEYIYDETDKDKIVASFVRYRILNGEGQALNHNMRMGLSDEDWQSILDDTAKNHAPNSEVSFTEDGPQMWAPFPLLAQRMAAFNIGSLVSFTLSENQRLKHQIDLVWSQPRTFDEAQRRLFTAINAQVQIIYKNQSYLAALQANTQSAEQQVRALRLLNEINARAGAAREETPFLQDIAPLLLDVFHADNLSYSVREPNRLTFTLNFTYPLRDLPPEVRVFQAPDLDQAEPIWMLEHIADMPLDENLRRIYEIYNIQSQMLMPITDAQQNLVGVIGLGYERITPLTDDVKEVATTFAAQINVGLQKMQLLNRSQRQAEQMAQLALLSQSVQAVLDETTILRTVLRELRRVLPYDYLTLLLTQADDILVQAAYATPAESVIVSERKPYDLNKDAIARQAWEEQGPAHADNVRRTWSWDHPLRASLGSIVAVPLFLGSRALGLIEVGSAAVYAYSETDITALLQVGNQIALALENARDLERTERLARNRALANRISTVMQEQMDVETILQAALKEVGKAVGARRARIRLGQQDTSGSQS